MQIQKNYNNKKRFFILMGFLLIVIVIGCTVWFSSQSSAPPGKIENKKTKNHKKPALVTPPVVFDKSMYSTTDPQSIWVVVNKQHPLTPRDFIPNMLSAIGGSQIRSDVLSQLQEMIAGAKAEGITLRIISGYRSYNYQVGLYNSYVSKDGQAQADTYSARPGFSEHQTGLAADIGGVHGCDVEQCFGGTVEGQWLASHAGDYGFIIRYTPDKENITGYSAEPWHIRYIGKQLAGEMKKQGVETLEEFFSVTGGKQYVD